MAVDPVHRVSDIAHELREPLRAAGGKRGNPAVIKQRGIHGGAAGEKLNPVEFATVFPVADFFGALDRIVNGFCDVVCDITRARGEVFISLNCGKRPAGVKNHFSDHCNQQQYISRLCLDFPQRNKPDNRRVNYRKQQADIDCVEVVVISSEFFDKYNQASDAGKAAQRLFGLDFVEIDNGLIGNQQQHKAVKE